MSNGVLVDNDVALKISCYSLVSQALRAITIDGSPPAMLGVARFVIRGRLSRARNVVDVERASAAFEQLMQVVTLLEPDESELALAADFEAEANRNNLELDGGESQLLAILIIRAYRLLLTGDKRAIAAMATVAPEQATGRVACLEQLMAHIIGDVGAAAVRVVVCSEPNADRTLTLCCSCGRQTAPAEDDILAALASYAGHTNHVASGILLPGFDLVAVST